MIDLIAALIISFFIYGFVGWIWESIINPLFTEYRIRNRGFFNGPIIPIYAFGAIADVLLFSQDEKILSLFLEGAVVACTIEYITGYLLEKIYNRRWWDYSDKKFNLNGRICLEGFVAFGLFCVFVVKWIQPYLFIQINKISFITQIIIATVLVTLFVIDAISTFIQMAHIEEHIEHFKKDLEILINDFEDDFEAHTRPELIISRRKSLNKVQFKQLLKDKKFSEKRIVLAFPHLLEDENNETKGE